MNRARFLRLFSVAALVVASLTFPRLARASDPAPIDGLGLRFNGDLLPAATVGAALSFDPGTYTIAAVTHLSEPPFRWTFVGGGGALRVGSGAVGLLALKQVKRPPIDLMLCPDKQCLSEGRRQIEAAETRKLISTIGAGVGGASACAGVYVLIPKTRGQSDSELPRASPLMASLPSGAALIVRGAF